MKWLLFALGALMIFIGAACVASGYPIVEVERGWTLTIVGGVVMTGGALVCALGLFLVRIESLSKGLRRAWAESRPASSPPLRSDIAAPVESALRPSPLQTFQRLAGSPRESSSAPPPPAAAEVEAPQAAAPAPPPPPLRDDLGSERPAIEAPRPRLRRTPDFLRATRRETSSGGGEVDAAEAALLQPSAPPSEPASPKIEPPPDVAAHAPTHESPSEQPPTEELAPEPAEIASAPAPEASPPHVEAPAGPVFRRFPVRSLTLPRGPWPPAPEGPAPEDAASQDLASQDLASQSPASRDLAPESPELEHSSGRRESNVEDAAQSLRFELPDNVAAGESAPATDSGAEDWFERALAELDDDRESEAPSSAAEPTEEGQGEPLATAVAVEPQEQTVIGRYETEGTLYVMYADGSIDAQTASGVYRFESLAALKSHIEGLA